MDDDDDSGLLDFIGDSQALNYFLHGSGSKSADDALTNTDYSASNSNSIFANISLAESKSSIKSAQSQSEEESNDGLQLSNSIQFFDDDLESSSIPDLSEDILQKSLQEANITEQILAEEAYLDASVGSSQQFANVPLHSHSSASYTQATSAPNYSGQTLHPIGVTHVPVVPQQVGASFASNTVGVQHGFMQHVGIIPSQHMPNNNQSSSGQIHLIGSINNQPPMMTINNLDGSHIILKSGQQASANAGGGLLLQRHTPNGNAMFGSPHTSPAGQPVAVPFNSGNFPVHNIIIHRGPPPNPAKAPINIQPKPMQVGQQASYNVNNLGMHHHRHQGVHFVPSSSPQSSAMGQQMPVNHQGSRKPSSQQSGGSIVIHHSPLGQTHGHHNQFLIPAGLSVNSGSVHNIQAINTQLVQTQPSHLGAHQVTAEHVMLSRNSAGMVRPSQQYPGQMLHSPGTAVQLVSGQTFTGSGGQVILNHGQSQIVGGQMTQLSPTLLHLSPGQVNTAHGRSTPTGCPNMSSTNRFTLVSSGTVLQSMGPSFQNPGAADAYIAEQQKNRSHSESHLPASSSTLNNQFCPNTGSQQSFSCNQALKNHISPVLSLKNQERQSRLPDHNSGSKHLQHHLSLSQETLMGSQMLNVKAERYPERPKRPAAKQLTKEALVLQQLQKDQESAVLPDKSEFDSLDDAVQRLLPYHVFQGSLPTDEELQKVDNEFESMATHLLKKTQAMLNKYRLLLLDDAMRINPSAEMVMLDRMFNQEERATLTREKRMALVDPDGYLAEFCCAPQFREDSSDRKLLRNHREDTYSTLAGACPMANVSKDKTGLSASKTATPCLVPNNNLSPLKRKDSSEERDSLNKDGKLKNMSLSPRKQLLNIYKLKGKYSECTADPDAPCRTTKDADTIVNTEMSIPVSGSNTDRGDVEHPQGFKIPGPSLEPVGEQRDMVGSPGKHCKSLALSKTVKATVRNVVELKLSAKHLKSEVTSSNSGDLDFVKCSAAASENCLDKPGTREGAAETDSVLEAAVNSILEC